MAAVSERWIEARAERAALRPHSPLAQRLAPEFDPTASDATLAALDLWQAAQPDVAGYLLKSAHVRRLNSLEAHQDMEFCVRLDAYDLVPVFRDGKITL